VWKFHLSDIGFGVAQALIIQDLLGRCWIIHQQANQTISLRGNRLECHNVHSALGKGSTHLSESARPVLYVNGQFFRLGRVGPPFASPLRTQRASRTIEELSLDARFAKHHTSPSLQIQARRNIRYRARDATHKCARAAPSPQPSASSMVSCRCSHCLVA
jgi:hypothetical protein